MWLYAYSNKLSTLLRYNSKTMTCSEPVDRLAPEFPGLTNADVKPYADVILEYSPVPWPF